MLFRSVFGSEIVGLLLGPKGEDGKDGEGSDGGVEYCILYGSEFVPGVAVVGTAEMSQAGYAIQIFTHTVTAEDVTRKYFDFPDEFPEAAVSRRNYAALSVETDVQIIGFDFEIIENDNGELRRISWAGLGLENDPPMQEGWRVTVWYHASVFAEDNIDDELRCATYTHTQTTPSNVWHAQHNLGGVCVVALSVDGTGEQIVGQQDFLLSTNNLLILRFSEPLSGKAYIKLQGRQ